MEAVNHFEEFYEEVFSELAKFGEVDEIVVADNIGDHMIGNVYVKFQQEDQSQKAMSGLNQRYYAGRVIAAEFSPVTDFKEAKCRQYKEGSCDSKFHFYKFRGGLLQLFAPQAREQGTQKAIVQADVRGTRRVPGAKEGVRITN